MKAISSYQTHSYSSQSIWYPDTVFAQDNSPGNNTKNFWHNEMVSDLACGWDALKEQILVQWNKLTKSELEETGPNRNKLAQLINNKYDIETKLIENYLRNFERSLPVT